MRGLTVVYDQQCGFCVQCRLWLEAQPTYVAMRFLRNRDLAADPRLAGLVSKGPVEELIVISDEGKVYRGAKAWILCLWALKEYRPWAMRLSRPALMPFARAAFDLVLSHRKAISRRLGLRGDAELQAALKLQAAGANCAPPVLAMERVILQRRNG